MINQNPQEQAVKAKMAAETTEQPIFEVKAAISALSARQILKLIFLALALIVWYPIYSRLAPFSLWITYDIFRIAQGTHLGDTLSFFFWIYPRFSCC